MEKCRWLIGLITILAAIAAAAGDLSPPPEGGILPEIVLPVPDSAEQRIYLGMRNGDGKFRIPEIDAEVVIVEIFSMY